MLTVCLPSSLVTASPGVVHGRFLLLLLAGLAVAALLAVALGLVAEAGPVGWLVLLALGGVVMVAGKRKKAERAAEERRKQEQQERKRAEARTRRGRRTDYIGRHRNQPVDDYTPLPRKWARPPQRARTAVENYRRAVDALRESPQREYLSDQHSHLAERAEECDQIARRAAELDRQLRHMEKHDPERGMELEQSIERAEARLRETVDELERLAVHAAHVSVAKAMDDIAALDDAAEDLRHELEAASAAWNELDGETATDATPLPNNSVDRSESSDKSGSTEHPGGRPPSADNPAGLAEHARSGLQRARITLRTARRRRR